MPPRPVPRLSLSIDLDNGGLSSEDFCGDGLNALIARLGMAAVVVGVFVSFKLFPV